MLVLKRLTLLAMTMAAILAGGGMALAGLGQPSEFAELVQHIVENRYLNGTSIRIDAGARM